jgi:3-isopropylmalate/(R)-2-methylmalate dehydratase small subunit
VRGGGGDRPHYRSPDPVVTMLDGFQGRARVVGDDINSDYIIASRRKRDTIDESALARYLLEGVDPAFAASVRPNDILVAGRNFGCGSAMEVAATVILAAGIHAVLARSFARSFYRNAVNNGLLPVECDTARIGEGDSLSITSSHDAVEIVNHTRGFSIRGTALPPIMADILHAGGLVGYIRRHGGFRVPL